MDEKKQIEEMAKCCTYHHDGECCADATSICDCDLMCEMFGVFANLEKAGYRKQSVGEWMSAYDYALKLGITDEKRLSDAKKDKWWKFCNKCEQAVKGFRNYCPNCGARMKGGEGDG